MQLKHLYLKQYKNLIEFEVDFNKPISVIIGRNGSGKSNLIEAVTEIFRNLFYTKSLSIPFAYTIEYRIGIINISVSTLDGTYKIKIDDKEVELNKIQKITKSRVHTKIPEKLDGILPDNILLYYSGQSTRMSYHFSKIENDYQNALKNGLDLGFKPLFLFHPIHYKFILLGLFASKLDDIKIFLNEKFGINELVSFDLHLKKPDWSTGNKAKSETFWNAKKIVFEYLSKITTVATDKIEISKDKLVFSFSSADKLEQLINLPIIGYESNLVKLLDSLYTAGFIEDLVIKFKINEGMTEISSDQLSEGEQQLIAIKGVIELLSGKETLFLLDEPDNYLHPSWQENLLEDLSVYVENASFLITTHSPQLLSNANPKYSEVIVLSMGKRIENIPNYFGKDINSILYNIMDSTYRNQSIKSKLNELFKFVSLSDIVKSEESYNELVKVLGEDDPDLISAKTEIDYLKYKINETDSEKY
ncbi:MAG: AAA family ATPase [Ignavibacteriaceae bacterium]